MAAPGTSAKPVRFGAFEVDLAAGELRKGGLKIKLQEQPFRVLAFLLERPGQIVTREELRQQLWSDDTFVDFDQGLNTTINKIREALGDSASHPRFVETLPRRGYRFVYPVEGAQHPASEAVLPRQPYTRWHTAAAAFAIIAAGVVAWFSLRGSSEEPAELPPTVVPLGGIGTGSARWLLALPAGSPARPARRRRVPSRSESRRFGLTQNRSSGHRATKRGARRGDTGP